MIRIALLLFSLAVAGCSRGMNQAELPGRYEFSYDTTKQHVTLGVDGTYTNTFYKDNRLVWSEKETWIYYKETKGYSAIRLEHFRFGLSEYTSGGSWFAVPEKTLTGVKRLCFDPDLYRCFDTEVEINLF